MLGRACESSHNSSKRIERVHYGWNHHAHASSRSPPAASRTASFALASDVHSGVSPTISSNVMACTWLVMVRTNTLSGSRSSSARVLVVCENSQAQPGEVFCWLAKKLATSSFLMRWFETSQFRHAFLIVGLAALGPSPACMGLRRTRIKGSSSKSSGS
jgi:hypothetical protein